MNQMEHLKSAVADGFYTKLSHDRVKLSQETGEYVKMAVREASFTNLVIPEQTATLADLERMPMGTFKDPVRYMVKEVEPTSFAITGAPLGFGISAPIRGRLLAIPKITFLTPNITYTKKTLEAYNSSIVQMLEENVVKDLADQVDIMFINMCEASLLWSATLGPNFEHFTSEVLPFTKRKFLNGLQRLVDPKGRPYQGARVLMNGHTHNHLLSLDDSQLGDQLAGQVFEGKSTFESILGSKYILTAKRDIVPDNVIYYFAPVADPTGDSMANMLGWNYLYKDINFTVESYHDEEFEFRATMEKMLCIGNGYGVAKLTLTDPLT